MRHIIVDGYNVIRADPRLQSFERVSLEQARDVLVRTLESSPRLAADRVTVVFDAGRGARQHAHSQRRGRIEVVYSARGHSADDVIMAQAAAWARDGRAVVVTNDVAVREHCRAEGCEVSSSENLLAQVPGGRGMPSYTEERQTPAAGLSTVKRGNPRRPPRRNRRRQDVRF